jgi:hypothetical protein
MSVIDRLTRLFRSPAAPRINRRVPEAACGYFFRALNKLLGWPPGGRGSALAPPERTAKSPPAPIAKSKASPAEYTGDYCIQRSARGQSPSHAGGTCQSGRPGRQKSPPQASQQ